MLMQHYFGLVRTAVVVEVRVGEAVLQHCYRLEQISLRLVFRRDIKGHPNNLLLATGVPEGGGGGGGRLAPPIGRGTGGGVGGKGAGGIWAIFDSERRAVACSYTTAKRDPITTAPLRA